jgi:deoxyribodipyrimidine photo-lyase
MFHPSDLVSDQSLRLLPAEFPTDLKAVEERIAKFNTASYGSSRNFVNGHVSYLSPYISRGMISTRYILDKLAAQKPAWGAVEKFIQELAWRDFFQRVWQQKGEAINRDLRQQQKNVLHHAMPEKIMRAETGIEALDMAVQNLYTLGYVHNHCRMYLAAAACNIGQAHWHKPAQWMYFHLLDGDWASNALSWQWVAGAFSSKKYYANQDNINRYTGTQQTGTWLDHSYEYLAECHIPDTLRQVIIPALDTLLPHTPLPVIDPTKPTLIYNYYNLDPAWHEHEDFNRIMLLEPAVFRQYPVSMQCIAFACRLGKNIPGLQVFCGEFSELAQINGVHGIRFKEHPLNLDYRGIEEPRDFMSDAGKRYFPSFFQYWKEIEPGIRDLFQ